MSHLKNQEGFHRAFEQPVKSQPELPEPTIAGVEARTSLIAVEMKIRDAIKTLAKEPGRRALRLSLLLEEVGELLTAERRDSLVGIADALADIEVIADGTALEYGIPLDAVREEVHRANMSKLGNDGRPIYREDGKVMKGPRYAPPDVEGVLLAHGYIRMGYAA